MEEAIKRNPMGSNVTTRMLSSLKRSLASITAWGKIHKSHDESSVQASFLAGETLDRTPVLHPFGFLSRASSGSKCFAICNGSRRNLKIISIEGRAPIKLQEGESLVYTNKGNYLHCMADGSIKLSGSKVFLTSDSTNLVSIIEDLLEMLQTKPCVESKPLIEAADLQSINEKIGKFK